MQKVLKKSKLRLIVLLVIVGFFAIKSNRLLKTMYKDKIWAHQVNTIEKFELVAEGYAGVELDVVFKKEASVFDIYHPPEPSRNLFLKDYFRVSGKNKEILYWLDFKNLTDDNANQSASHLLELCEKNAIPTHRIIVESPTIQSLHFFRKNGFKTSFFLPRLASLKGVVLDQKIKELRQLMGQHPTTMISSHSSEYRMLKKYFPKKQKLLWILKELEDMKSLRNRLTILRRITDSTVQIILFDI